MDKYLLVQNNNEYIFTRADYYTGEGDVIDARIVSWAEDIGDVVNDVEIIYGVKVRLI